MSWWGGSQPGGQSWLAFLSPPLPFSLEAVRLGPCSGLLVDWLELLDPEVISSCPDLQQRLLFSRGKVGLRLRAVLLWALCLPTESRA